MINHCRKHVLSLAVATVVVWTGAAVEPDENDFVTPLEEFIIRHTSVRETNTLSQLARPVEGLFGSDKDLLDIPRSVTVLTPEAMRQYGITDFNGLVRAAAGAQRANYYGVPGAPQFRGDFATVYFNGMERVYQRNEMPTSFGSLEALDLVKGPAPAHFGPTQAGGFVNMIPKSPFFDRFRGSVRLTVGSHDHLNSQFDVGGPFLAGNVPAAYRISITGQKSGTYWDNMRNDYLSAYVSGKFELRKDVTVFSGAEYYRFRSNENAGWNRVTQELIDEGLYITGEVVDLVNHPANRSSAGLSKGVTPFVLVPATPGSDPVAFSPMFPINAAAIIPPSDFVATLTPEQRALLDPVTGAYTAAYLNGPDGVPFTDDDGPVAKTRIQGSTVLADPDDYADSESFLYFMDYRNASGNAVVLNQLLVEGLRTEKLSSYGYAFDSEQLMINNKLSIRQGLGGPGEATRLTYGVGVKYNHARQLQDFDDEPFSRRDISNPVISPNSVVLSGPRLDDDGVNHWSIFEGASFASDLYQAGLFAVADTRWNSRLSTLVSMRVEGARFRTFRPRENVRRPDAGEVLVNGRHSYWNASAGPVVRLTPELRLYASVQRGATFSPSQGGVVNRGRGNFSESELYEAGVKGSFLEDSLYASVAVYSWDKVIHDPRSGVNHPLRGEGVEFETTYVSESGLSWTANVTVARARLRGLPGFRLMPTQEYYVPLVAGGHFAGGPVGDSLILENNPDRVVPGRPEIVVNAHAGYQFAGGFGLSAGPTWRDGYWHNFDRTIRLPSTFILNGNIWFRADRWEIFGELTNITREDYYLGSDPFFAANTIITKAPMMEGKIGFVFRF